MLVSELAKNIAVRFFGEDASFHTLTVANRATCDDIAIFLWEKDLRALKGKKVAAVLADEASAARHAHEIDTAWLISHDLFETFRHLAGMQQNGFVNRGKIDNTATIHPSAFVAEDVFIGEGAVIMAGARVLKGSSLGNYCVIGPNTVVGSEPFCPYGTNPSRLLPALGHVQVGDHVHIGANCTIARGLVVSTKIGAYSLLDDQVHVGHDSLIGENVIIAGQSALAGLTQIKNHVTIGGQAGIGPHVVIGEGSRISGRAGVVKDVADFQVVSGFPARPHHEFLRRAAKINKD